RRRHAGDGREGGAHRDLPALRRGDEEALGEARVFAAAVAYAVAVGAVDQARADRRQVDVVRRDVVGPPLARRRGEAGVAELEALGSGARQPLRVEVAGEVGVLVLVADGLEVFLEESARR